MERNPNLTPQQINVLHHKDTEPPFTGKYLNHKEDGSYVCANCGNVLFTSDTKFDSGSGWPSFSEVAEENAVTFLEDTSYNMARTEVICSKCGGHLGHVFKVGPESNSNYYCINSCVLDFKKSDSD